MTQRFHTIDSPIGELLLTSDGRSLTRIHMLPRGAALHRPAAHWRRDPAALDDAELQLREYFAGRRTEFDLPLAPEGTPFQRRVWEALREIPYGTTVSYGELARRVGHPDGARAVGAANGRNPIAIVIPCHRVIGAGGALVGYGGGLDRKRVLLELEAATAGRATLRLDHVAAPGLA